MGSDERAERAVDTGGAVVAASAGATLADSSADTMLADATLRVGFVAPDGRPRRQPEDWRTAFKTILDESDR